MERELIVLICAGGFGVAVLGLMITGLVFIIKAGKVFQRVGEVTFLRAASISMRERDRIDTGDPRKDRLRKLREERINASRR